MNSSQLICQVCQEQAFYLCSECSKTAYCSKDHQEQHWKRQHKKICGKKISKKSQTIQNLHTKVLEMRKSYFENFSSSIFLQCLIDAKVMLGYQQQIIKMNDSSLNELNYGATVCLLIKTYILLNLKEEARTEMDFYMKKKKTWIEDTSKFDGFGQMIIQGSKHGLKEQLQQKLNLISGIANLCYAIGMDCITYYVIYTRHITKIFGSNSLETSNCYFLLGCFFAEEGNLTKSIIFFKKAAKIRDSLSADCWYNVGVLQTINNKTSQAIDVFETSINLFEKQSGEDSKGVINANQMLGILYLKIKDFKTSMNHLQRVYNLRANKQSQGKEFENTIQLIQDLYHKLCYHIEKNPNMKKPHILKNLKNQISSEEKYMSNNLVQRFQEEPFEKQKYQIQKQFNLMTELEEKQPNKQKKQRFLKITEDFVTGLNQSELFKLSQLQLELQKCQTIFEVIYTLGVSTFLETLSQKSMTQFKKDNEKLFKHYNMEHLKKK